MKTQENNTEVPVRMLIDIMGGFHGLEGVSRGDIVTLPEMDALRYEFFGYCEPVDAADETPQMHKVRVDRTTAAVQQHLAALNAESKRSATSPGAIDTATGKPVANPASAHF
jgi:hypothetical protein